MRTSTALVLSLLAITAPSLACAQDLGLSAPFGGPTLDGRFAPEGGPRADYPAGFHQGVQDGAVASTRSADLGSPLAYGGGVVVGALTTATSILGAYSYPNFGGRPYAGDGLHPYYGYGAAYPESALDAGFGESNGRGYNY